MSEIDNSPNPHGQVLAEQTHLQLPSRPEWIEPTVEFLKQKAVLCGACSETRSANLLIALHEAMTNAVVHGNLEVSSALKELEDDSFVKMMAARAANATYAERPVDIFIDYDGKRCQWTISDQGPGFDVDGVLARQNSDDPEVMLASGRGILLMRSFLDDVRFESGGRRVVLTLKQESGTERRHHSRVAMHTRLRVAPVREDGSVDWDAAYAAIARNFSQGGLGLIQNQLAQSGRVLIGIYSGAEPVYVPAEIRHLRSLGGDMVELGCCFSPEHFDTVQQKEPGPPADVEQAIERMLEGKRDTELPAKDRRRNPRVPFTQQIEIIVDPNQPHVTGYSRDLSKGGIAFLTTSVLTGVVTIIFHSHDQQTTLRVNTKVIRCTKVQEGFYDVGGQFLSVE